MSNQFKALTERQKLLLDMAQTIHYKKAGENRDLSIHFYFPKNLKEGPKRPVFLFFHSGAFDRGNPIQFAPHALYFVERGAVCGLVEYRTKAIDPESTPMDAVQDGHSAIRFVRHFEEKFHADPDKLVAFGAGAGGNIAGCAALKAHVPAHPDDFNLCSPRPNAVVLFSPILEIIKDSYSSAEFDDASMARKLSLTRYISGGCPPMQVFHGTLDRLIPISISEKFVVRMARRRNKCELFPFEGRDHNYYNMNVDPVSYEACLTLIDGFLARHGILPENTDESGARLISWREEDF